MLRVHLRGEKRSFAFTPKTRDCLNYQQHTTNTWAIIHSVSNRRGDPDESEVYREPIKSLQPLHCVISIYCTYMYKDEEEEKMRLFPVSAETPLGYSFHKQVFSSSTMCIMSKHNRGNILILITKSSANPKSLISCQKSSASWHYWSLSNLLSSHILCRFLELTRVDVFSLKCFRCWQALLKPVWPCLRF